jgi:hypothetical protein
MRISLTPTKAKAHNGNALIELIAALASNWSLYYRMRLCYKWLMATPSF